MPLVPTLKFPISKIGHPTMKKSCISIIIPTLNEEYYISKLLPHLWQADVDGLILEVLLADAGSTDHTISMAIANKAVVIHCPQKGRAKQMNYAAKQAKGTILHFIHADAFPPQQFTRDVIKYTQSHQSGCFRSLFDTNSRFLRFNSYFTRFRGIVFRGGGQTLFVDRQLFYALNGYREDMVLMEEYDFILRLKKKANFEVVQRDVLVSARDYEKHGNVSLQARYFVLYVLFFSGMPHTWLTKAHRIMCRGKASVEKTNVVLMDNKVSSGTSLK